MYKRNLNTMGCCGLNMDHMPNEAVSLFGVVDTEEESKEFISRCEQQLTFLHPEYPHGKPVFWSWKHPDIDRWYVSYQLPCKTTKNYKDSEVLDKKLKYQQDLGGYTVEKNFKQNHPLNVYLNSPFFDRDDDYYVNYVSGFGCYFETFKSNEARHKNRNNVFACTLHWNANNDVQKIKQFLKKERNILFDVQWHNPFYPMKGSILDPETDGHVLHTFFYKVK